MTLRKPFSRIPYKVMARSSDGLFRMWRGGVIVLLVAVALLLASCGT